MGTDSQPLPPKKEVALALLSGSSVFVHLDPRAADVQVPEWFKKQPQLVLQIGLNMPVPIPDLHLDDQKMSCTLSFNRSPFLCVVPWSAVFAMVDEEGRAMVWPEDVPPEVQAQAKDRAPGSTDNVRDVRSVAPRGSAGSGATAAAKAGTAKGTMRPTPLEAVKSVGAKGDSATRKPKSDGKTKGGKGKPDGGRVVELRSAGPASASKDAPPGDGPARVPPPRTSTTRLEEPRDDDALRRALEGGAPPAAEVDAGSAAERSTPPKLPQGGGSGKPARKTKREIPPYLRVVK